MTSHFLATRVPFHIKVNTNWWFKTLDYCLCMGYTRLAMEALVAAVFFSLLFPPLWLVAWLVWPEIREGRWPSPRRRYWKMEPYPRRNGRFPPVVSREWEEL